LLPLITWRSTFGPPDHPLLADDEVPRLGGVT
jgi:hypothetical protein